MKNAKYNIYKVFYFKMSSFKGSAILQFLLVSTVHRTTSPPRPGPVSST